MRANTHARTHARTHSRTHAHTHTRTHAHTSACARARRRIEASRIEGCAADSVRLRLRRLLAIFDHDYSLFAHDLRRSPLPSCSLFLFLSFPLALFSSCSLLRLLSVPLALFLRWQTFPYPTFPFQETGGVLTSHGGGAEGAGGAGASSVS